MKRILFLAWQDPVGRTWYPIGRLTSDGGRYSFTYLGGARSALDTGRFEAIRPFPDLHTIYEADELFPLFANRVLPRTRPEYKSVLEWLSVSDTEDDPVAILARSGGQRATDTFEVFPCPEQTEEGHYNLHFLLHGLSHMPPEAVARAEHLKVGESLLVMKDFQNPHDELALALRTSDNFVGDKYLVGYFPRYLRSDILKLMGYPDNLPAVTVERVNPPPAPVQFRVLCRLEMAWPHGFQPFSGPEFQPVVGQIQDAHGLARVF